MGAIVELFATIGVKTEGSQQIKTMENSFLGLKSKIALVALAFGKFTYDTMNAAASLQNINLQTGLSIQKLQQLQQVAMLSNWQISADEVASSMASIQKSIADIKMGQGNIKPFQMLGIDISGDAFSVLQQLRGRLQGLDRSTATNLATSLGISPNMINLLKLSNAEFEKLAKGTFLSNKQVKDINTMSQAFRGFTISLKQFKDQAVARTAPAFTKFFIQLKSLVDKYAMPALDAIAFTFKTLKNAFSEGATIISGIINLVSNVSDLKGAFVGLAGVLAGFAFLLSPFVRMATVISGIILLLDDLAVYRRGGQSAFESAYQFFGIDTKDTEYKMGGRLNNNNIKRPKGLIPTAIDWGKEKLGFNTNGLDNKAFANGVVNNNTNMNIVQNINGTSSPNQVASKSAEEIVRAQMSIGKFN